MYKILSWYPLSHRTNNANKNTFKGCLRKQANANSLMNSEQWKPSRIWTIGINKYWKVLIFLKFYPSLIMTRKSQSKGQPSVLPTVPQLHVPKSLLAYAWAPWWETTHYLMNWPFPMGLLKWNSELSLQTFHPFCLNLVSWDHTEQDTNHPSYNRLKYVKPPSLFASASASSRWRVVLLQETFCNYLQPAEVPAWSAARITEEKVV